jgi:hypothetical protein
MSTNKKFRIQNGADIHGGGLSIDDVIVIGADGKVVAGAIQEAVAELTAADIADLQAQVTAILGTSPETLDTLQEIVTAFQDADTNLVASVASNSSDIATINATLTSGVATPADVAALDTFVKGTTSELVGDSWSVESNWTLLEAAHYVGTQWGNQYDGYFGIERKGAWEQGGHNESTYVGEHSHTEGEFAEFVQTVTPGEEITIDLTVLNTGFGTTYIRLEDDGQTVTEFAPIIQTYVTTDQGDGNNVGQLVHSHTFTPTSSSIKIVVGDVPSHLQESNVSSSGARIYLKGVSITTAAPSLGTDASTVVGAVNEVHTEVDALTVAVATAKSEAISTASADATAKADAAEADAKAYADQVVAATVDAAPAALDTLNELAAALGDDANFASTVTASIGSNTSAISSLDVFVGDGRTGPPNAITSIAASNWTVLQSGITITDNPDGSVTFTTDGSNAGEMAEILVDVDNVAYEFAANVVGYHATAHYLSTKRASDNASISGFAFNTGGSVGGNGSGWSNTSGYADQVKVIITFGTVAGGTSWTFNSISLYDPEAADAPALDTSAQTIADAVNEVHAELGALSATQSGDTSSLTTAIATAKSEAISTASADATAKADAAEADAKAYADQVVAATVDAAPAALDTLNELAAALGDDANFASTVTASIATKASQVDHDAEVARATAAEGVNASAIAATNARTSGISTSSGSTDIQMTAEVDMDSNKVTNMADPTAAQDAATKAYVDAASTSSSSDLSAETAARIAADTNLQSQITALSGSTDGKDSDLQDAINAEESARIAADAVLQNNIDAEAAVRASADLALTGDISDEADARIAGDNAITAALNTEIGDRQSGDNALQTQIDFITSNTDPAALDSLTEIVAAFQSADDSITGVVTSNTTRISALEGSVTGIEAWNTDNVSEGTTNLYFTDARAKACLTGGLCITYNTTTGEISVDETEAESSLRVAESVASDDADKLDGQEGTYYRINVYNVAGTLVN